MSITNTNTGLLNILSIIMESIIVKKKCQKDDIQIAALNIFLNKKKEIDKMIIKCKG